MYYVLQCFAPLFKEAAGLGECPEVERVETWMSGALITVPIPQPLRLTLDPDAPGELLEMYQLEMLLMTDHLVGALEEAGVDNLQVFRAEIVDSLAGTVLTNYRVVNIVGAIACADMEKSTFESRHGPPIVDVDFERLVIDERRAAGHLLFRLGECVSAIVVHERIKTHLLARGFDMLTFQLPSEFVG